MGLLDGKVALITGAGRGIGRATAQLFAQHGARLVLNDLDEGPALETVESAKRLGADAVACAGSVTDEKFADRWIGAALDSFGHIDILVNNAGFTWDAVIHKMTDQQWDAILDLHCYSVRTASWPMAGFL